MSKTFIILTDRHEENTLTINPDISAAELLRRLADSGFLTFGTSIDLPDNDKVVAEWGPEPGPNCVIMDNSENDSYCLALHPRTKDFLRFLSDHDLLEHECVFRFLDEEDSLDGKF